MVLVHYEIGDQLDSVDVDVPEAKIRHLKLAIFGNGLTPIDATKVRISVGDNEFKNNDSPIPVTSAENRLRIKDERGKPN